MAYSSLTLWTQNITRLWPDDDGINVMGTPLGTPDFIDSYLFGKGIKHRQLLTIIQEVALASIPSEAIAIYADG